MANGPELLALRGARAGHGVPPVIDGADLSISKGDRLCLVGRNGSGKSTLLAALQGHLGLDAGERYLMPGVSVASLPQDPQPPESGTVMEFVCEGGAEAYRAESMIHALGLDPEAPAATLSGGQTRRASLAAALALDPDVLLLDEPTNHLDLPAIEWLEEELASFRGGLLVISHDRAFLNRVGNGILWLDRGQLRRLDAPFERFERWDEEVEQADAAELNRMDQHIKAEARYLHRGVTARRKRNVRRLEKLASLRKERQARTRPQERTELKAQEAVQSGKVAVEAKGLGKTFGEREIVRDFSLRMLRGDRIGIVGPNGAGKTTLVKMLIGELAPDAGEIRQGTNLEVAWFDQTRAQLDPNSTPWDVIGEGTDRVEVAGATRHVVGYLKDFMFDERQTRGKIKTLSGGERNRLLLAKILMKPSNFMVLDEPTNDLDMETLDLLEEILGDYEGSLILVSHDRDFLDRLVTSIIAVEGDGRIREFVGGYQDYRRQVADEREAARPQKQVKAAAQKPRAKAQSVKLSYKDQRDLDMLPERMEKLEGEITELQALLGQDDLFNREPDRFQKAVSRLEAAQGELAEAEERWLELEMMREEMLAAKTQGE